MAAFQPRDVGERHELEVFTRKLAIAVVALVLLAILWAARAVLILIFIAGVFFPVNNVPDWLAAISKLNPLTYGVDAIRQIFLGSSTGLGVSIFGHTMAVAEELLLIAALGVVMLGGAVIAFNRDS